MKRVLLTGGTGFIGKNAVPFLVDSGYDVHAISTKQIVTNKKHNDVKWHHSNLFDPDDMDRLFREVKPTHLLHFAWDTTPGSYWTSQNNLHWVQSGLDMLMHFSNQGGERAVLAGTCAEYDWLYGCCKEETTPLLPATLYGVCKNSLQKIAARFFNQNNISNAWGRVFYLYGPGERQSRLVASVINALLHDVPAPCSHGRQIRDFLYVKDVAAAFVALLESNVQGAVNIASGNPVSLKAVIDMISAKIGRQDLVKYGAVPTGKNDPGILIADVEKLNNEVGWFPQYDLSTGLDETIDWWKNENNN